MEDELLTTTKARDEYAISTERMKQLLATGAIPFQHSPLDKRVKLIRRGDMEQWKKAMTGIPRPARRKKAGATQ